MSDQIQEPPDTDAFETETPEDPQDPELDLEVNEADAAEQRLDLLQQQDVPIISRPDDANPADVAEQSRVVGQEEDDYPAGT